MSSVTSAPVNHSLSFSLFSRHSEWEILIWDDTFANLEKLFIIFASTLMGAVILAVVVFCTILFVSVAMASNDGHSVSFHFSLFPLQCRLLILRMRTRGLSRLQVRALPKRKYHKMKETAESCSICLEEFKEGETIRVLPCEHGESCTLVLLVCNTFLLVFL